MTWTQLQAYVVHNGQWIGYDPPEQPPPPPATGLGLIGDTLTNQSGSTAPQQAIVDAGWETEVRVDAANNRQIAAASSVITGWRAAGFDPDTYVIALGSYNLADTDPQWITAIGGVLDTINAGQSAPIYTVYWVGISLRDSVVDTRATRFMAVLNGLIGTRAKVDLRPLDWNTYIHGGDQTGVWDAADTNQRLMTATGYDWRNRYVGALVNGVNPPDRPRVGTEPVSSFTASTTSGDVPLAVTFTDTSTGSPTAWSWNFGDGTTATVQNPSKTYTVAGTYTVTLAARNATVTDPTPATRTITAAGTTPPPPPGTWVFESAAVEGGGFQNAIAVSPFKNGTQRPYLIGADVSGIHRSVDRGATWVPMGGSGSINASMRIAGIMWSDQTPGKVFVAEDGGIHMSTDWGVTYSPRSTVPDWDANNKAAEPAGSPWPEHPRQTGFIMAQDNSTATKHVWCGTLTQGLKRSTDNFATFAATTMLGHPIRSIAVDPNDPDVVYVCVNRGTAAQNGFWKVTNARGAMTATKMTAYPGVVNNVSTNPIGPEEVIAVDQGGTTHVYVAGHESGMFKYLPGTNQWFTINSGLTINGSATYRSVCADPSNPEVIYCAHWHPASRKSIYRSANSGSTWTQISAATPGSIIVDYTVFGQNFESFLKDIPYHNFSGPSNDWVAAMIAIDPDVPNRVITAGRGGAWFGTLSGGVRTWQPAVHGLMVTVMMAVEADELVNGRAVFGNMDYTSIYTSDAGAEVAYMSHDNAAFSVGDAVTIDKSVTTGPGRLYVGSSPGKQNTGNGMVWSTPGTPPRGVNSAWVNETGAAWSGDVVGLAVGETAGGATVILAGAQTSGVWRKVGATWSKLGAGAPTVTGSLALRWRRNSPMVYAVDGSGLWRSDDAGATWTKILNGVTATYGTYDSLRIDPTDNTKVYVSSGGTVQRVNNASTSTGTGATTTTTIWSGQAGNIAINPNGTEMFINVRDGRLMRSTLFRTAGTQAAANWSNVANNLFQRMSGSIRSMTCTPGGVILTADNGSGVFRGYRV